MPTEEGGLTRPRDICPRNQARTDIDPASGTVPLSQKVQEWSTIAALSLACGKALHHQGGPDSGHRPPELCRAELRTAGTWRGSGLETSAGWTSQELVSVRGPDAHGFLSSWAGGVWQEGWGGGGVPGRGGVQGTVRAVPVLVTDTGSPIEDLPAQCPRCFLLTPRMSPDFRRPCLRGLCSATCGSGFAEAEPEHRRHSRGANRAGAPSCRAEGSTAQPPPCLGCTHRPARESGKHSELPCSRFPAHFPPRRRAVAETLSCPGATASLSGTRHTGCCHFLTPATATLWGRLAPGQRHAGSKGRARSGWRLQE